jgi:signal transduction histidine kinase
LWQIWLNGKPSLKQVTKVVNDTNNLTKQKISALHVFDQNLFFITTSGFFYSYKINDTVVTKLKVHWENEPEYKFVRNAVYNKISKKWILVVALKSDVTKSALFEASINGINLTLKQIQLPPDCNYILRHASFDLNNNLWLSYENHLPCRVELHEKNGRSEVLHFEHISYYNNDEIKWDAINATYCDNYNRLWLIGVNSIFVTDLNNKLLQAPTGISALQQINKYSGCDAVHFDKAGIYLTMPSDSILFFGFNGTNKSILIKRVASLGVFKLHADFNGDLYLATFNGVKYIPYQQIAKANNVIEASKLSEHPLQKQIDSVVNNKMSSCLYSAPDSSLFIGAINGLYKIDKARKNVVAIRFGSTTLQVHDMVWYHNAYYIATDNGLYKMDIASMQALLCNQNIFDSINKSAVHCLTEVDNKLWVGTYKGLFVYDANSDAVKSILNNETTIQSLNTDAYKNIWVATKGSGLLFFKKGSHIADLITDEDGLMSMNFTEGAGKFVNLPNKNVLLLSQNGFNCINPKQWPKSIKPISIQINEVAINYTSVLSTPTANYENIRKSILQQRSIDVPFFQNNFNITFSDLSGNAPHAITYFVKLEGFDHAWMATQPNKNINYEELRPYRNSYFFPGSYLLQLKSVTQTGKTSVMSLLTISVGANFWRSYEFYSVIFILVLALFIYIIRYFAQLQLREKLRDQENLLAIERERNRISEDLHDDLGAGLSSIAMMTGVMRELITDDESKTTADEVSNEANELVARMREIIWSMNSKNDTLENLLTYVNDYCHRYLSKNKIGIQMQMMPNVPQIIIDSASRENIFLVVKETLHNIVKYAESQQVIIEVFLKQNILHICIEDNGKGFDMGQVKRFGNGLINMKQRIQKINGNFEIESAPGKGTNTKISVPFKNSSVDNLQ